MSEVFLEERRRSLEESFFAARNQELLGRMRHQREKEALAEVSGITNDQVLEELMGHQIGSDTLAALSLVPLIQVAWADGHVAFRERQAILAAAHDAGISEGSPSYRLLESWLEERPGADLLHTWEAYVQALTAALGPQSREELKRGVLERARQVAEAVRGTVGIGRRISDEEQRTLDRLAAAFEPAA